MIVLEFPYTSPPLTANQRLHWRKKATITRDVRELTGLLANRVSRMSACTVELVWFVNTKHRRDVDNVTPTLKAMCDGLVDANVVTDDTPDLMKKLMPEIVYEKGCIARMELRITEGIT